MKKIKLNKDGFVKIDSGRKGKNLLILSGIHGNEYFGVEAMCILLENIEQGKIKIKRGSVTFGFGNPQAMQKRVRYIETDLNDNFRLGIDTKKYTNEIRNSYEYKRARVIEKYLDKADILLDVHGSTSKFSKAFTICEPNAFSIVKKLGIKTIISGFDNVEPGGTDYYMNKKGKVGICVECGSLYDNEVSKKVAYRIMINFLRLCKVIEGKVTVIPNCEFLQINQKYYSKTNKFVTSKPLKDFEKIKKGQIIGVDGNEEIKSEADSFVLFATDADYPGAGCFLLGSTNLR